MRLLAAFSLVIATLGMGCSSVKPLSLHPANPHYFLFRGQPAVLISSGEHYGAVLNLDFDYIRYLDELHAKGLNHTRTFSGTYRELPASFRITENTLVPKPNRYLAPWARSSTPGYSDGGNKFDLTPWDEAYFGRLRDFVGQAGKRGIVVEVNLFCPLYDEGLWQANPMNARNNVNGVGQCPLNEVFMLAHEDLTRAQKAVAQKIVRALADFDNVYFEVCNEPWVGKVSTAWQDEIVSAIAEAEAPLPARHLISLNYFKGKIARPNPAVSIYNFHDEAVADSVAANYELNKAIGDNETGFRGRENLAYRTEAWDCLMAGGALFSSLDYSFTVQHPDGSFLDYKSPGGGNAELRKQLRTLKDFMHGFDFLRLTPNDAVVKSVTPAGLRVTRVLAEPGRAYAIYLRRRTDVDRFSVRWTGSVTPSRDETCTFHIVSNHGVRLWVNEQLLIDNARDHKTAENQGQIAFRAGHPAAIRMEYYQAGGGSVARLLWSSPTLEKAVVPVAQLAPPDGIGEGLRAEYFADRELKKLCLARTDPTIDFDWSRQSPFPASEQSVPVQLTLELPAGNYRTEWLDTRTGATTGSEDFQHAGGNKTLKSPPFKEDAALKLVSRGRE